MASYLQDGRDAGSPGDHADRFDHVGLVGKGALWAAHFDLVTDIEPVHVLGDGACRISLCTHTYGKMERGM